MKGNNKVLRHANAILFSISGFIIAIIVNTLVPQVASDVSLEEYPFAGFLVKDRKSVV